MSKAERVIITKQADGMYYTDVEHVERSDDSQSQEILPDKGYNKGKRNKQRPQRNVNS